MSDPSTDPRTNDEPETYPEDRQAETWNKDVEETGRWGSRGKKEVWIVVGLVLVMIAVATVGVVFGADKGETYLEGETKIDPESGEEVSAYELPKPVETKVSNQAELDILLAELSDYPVLKEYVGKLPGIAVDLNGKHADTNEDPYIRAASWLTTVDQSNIEQTALVRFALAAIYYETNGENWVTKTNWLSEENHCDWYGVDCCSAIPASNACRFDDFYRIVQIDLSANNLSGPIPRAIALFENLQALFMRHNKLTGNIDGSIFRNLDKFQKLYLQHNELTGTIPPPEELDASRVLGTCCCIRFVERD